MLNILINIIYLYGNRSDLFTEIYLTGGYDVIEPMTGHGHTDNDDGIYKVMWPAAFKVLIKFHEYLHRAVLVTLPTTLCLLCLNTLRKLRNAPEACCV